MVMSVWLITASGVRLLLWFDCDLFHACARPGGQERGKWFINLIQFNFTIQAPVCTISVMSATSTAREYQTC